MAKFRHKMTLDEVKLYYSNRNTSPPGWKFTIIGKEGTPWGSIWGFVKVVHKPFPVCIWNLISRWWDSLGAPEL